MRPACSACVLHAAAQVLEVAAMTMMRLQSTCTLQRARACQSWQSSGQPRLVVRERVRAAAG
jgi:hypothetical protein